MINIRIKKAIHILLLTHLSCLKSGCLFVFFNGPSIFEKKPSKSVTFVKNGVCPKARIYAVRGFLDIFSTGMDNLTHKIENQLNIPAQTLVKLGLFLHPIN